MAKFEKGQSGNPSGRPKEVAHVKELARQWTEEAISTLGQIMADAGQPPNARVKAAETLLNRAWGTPESHSTVTVNKDVRDLSTAEILAALAASGAIGEEASGAGDSPVH